MGGSAFKQAAAPGHPTLSTPRMNRDEYVHLRDTYLGKIQSCLANPNVKVAVLREAPEKVTYGDIDFFIGLDEPVDFVDMANSIGATGLIRHSAEICTLGVPKDGSSSQRPCIIYENLQGTVNDSHASVATTQEAYAQIDLEIVPIHLMDWHSFYSAYSDLNALLGHIVTNLGFTVSDQGLWLRMKELDISKTVERANFADDLGKVFLSRDPQQVMRFLGLSTDHWQSGVETLDELYEWLGACRLIHPVALKLKRDKAHERRRKQNRDVYRRFFFEWLPERLPDTRSEFGKEEQVDRIAVLRRQYLNEAVDFFDKRAIYEQKHRVAVHTLNSAIVSNLLRPIIVKHSGVKDKRLSELIRAFRRFVAFDAAGQPCLTETPYSDSESQLHGFLEDSTSKLKDDVAVDEFVRANWLRAKELERQRAKQTR